MTTTAAVTRSRLTILRREKPPAPSPVFSLGFEGWAVCLT
jgi:hypothetical protein